MGSLFAMQNKIRGLNGWWLGLMVGLPFLSCFRYAPLGDWVTDTTFVLLAGCFLLVHWRKQLEFTPFNIAILAFLLLQALSLALINNFQQAATLLLMFFLSLVVSGNRLSIRQHLPELAAAVLFFACLQACIGLIQFLHMEPLFHGWVVYVSTDYHVVFGNFGQRNLFSDFMMWGCLSACYLVAVGRLRFFLFFPLVVFFALIMSWSGSRTVLLYCLLTAGVIFYWRWRLPEDASLRRLRTVLLIAVVIILSAQFFNTEIVHLLNKFGLPVTAESGVNRFFAAGFGLRRRIEWAKAFDAFLAHPFLGLGLSGYASYSTVAEAFAGFEKVPEGALFTQCHNLFLQLLAETGLLGLLIVVVGILAAMMPLFQKKHASLENVFLSLLALVILCHSMLEYPLWYLPFLGMLVIVCSLVQPIGASKTGGKKLLSWLCLFMALGSIFYAIDGLEKFRFITHDARPSTSVEKNEQVIKRLVKIASNPLWTNDANLVLVPFIQPTRDNLELKLALFDSLVSYRPYSEVLAKSAMLHALNGDKEKALRYLKIGIANNPDDIRSMVIVMSTANEPAYAPLLEVAQKALFAYAAKGFDTDPGRVAAIMTVAAPVTRKPLFTF